MNIDKTKTEYSFRISYPLLIFKVRGGHHDPPFQCPTARVIFPALNALPKKRATYYEFLAVASEHLGQVVKEKSGARQLNIDLWIYFQNIRGKEARGNPQFFFTIFLSAHITLRGKGAVISAS